MDERLLQSAKNGKYRRGKSECVAHLEGKKLSWGKAIKAKCYDCQGMGDTDMCETESCSLLPYSPYRLNRRSAPVVERSKGEHGK